MKISRATMPAGAQSPRGSMPDTLSLWVIIIPALLTTLIACTIAREGSTIVRVYGSPTNGAPVTVNAAANGATAQAADNGASPHATSRGALAVASRWWLWVVVGLVAALIAYLVWKFVFTGARIALVH